MKGKTPSKKPPLKGGHPAGKKKETVFFSVRAELIWIVFIFLVGLLLYVNTLTHLFVLDDFSVIKDNFLVKRGLKGIPEILSTPYRFGFGLLSDNLYRPLTLVMFALEWQISPDNPALGHTINVIFYAFSGVLLYLFLRKLFYQGPQVLSLVVTLIWLAHPVHTEVVANIKSRDEIMSLFFLLLTLFAFLHFLDKKRFLLLALSLLSYFLALISKEGTISMLVLFPVIGWYYCKPDQRKRLFYTTLFLIPVIIYLLIRQDVLSQYATPFIPTIKDNLIAGAPDFFSRSATAILILGKYLLLLLFPYQLVSDASYNQIPITGWADPLVILAFLVYAAMLVYAFVFVKKKDVTAFGLLFFLITMSPYSNLFTLIGTSYAERLLYLPSIGFSIAFVSIMVRFLSRQEKMQPGPLSPAIMFRKYPVIWLITGLILVVFSVKTVARNLEWKDEFTLFSADVKRSPNSAHMRYYYGLALRNKAGASQNPVEVEELTRRAVEEFNKVVMIIPTFSEGHEQLGLAYYRLKQPEQAAVHYEEALRLNPSKAVTYSNLAILFYEKGDMQRAFELYQKSVSLDTNFEDGYFNLGSIYGMRGEYDKAILNFGRIIKINPSNARGHQYLGITYGLMNQPDLAKKHLDIARQLDPSIK
jgi:tetratricopeptide (TPR) repeat protein